MLELFLENWKKEALNYYKSLNEKYLQLKNEAIESENFKKIGSFRESISKKDFEIIQYKMNSIENIIEKEVDKKRKDFIKRVEKKAGKILDVSGLSIGKDGSLNGFVIGSEKKVYIETILAGGYNIQILHYRVLVK